MTDASKTRVSYTEEGSYGSDPGVGTDLKEFRYTSCSLAAQAGYIQSNEIRADRQPADQVRTSFTARGELAFELAQYDKFSSVVVGLLMTDAPVPSEIATLTATDLSFAATDNSINSGASAFTHAAGDWVWITGSPANGSFLAKVIVATTSKLTLSGKQIVAESAGASVSVDHRVQRDTGSTLRSFKFEIEPTGTGGLFQVYDGSIVSSMSIDIPATGVITGSLSLSCKTPRNLAVTSGSGTISAASTNPVMNTETNFYGLLMGGPEGTTQSILTATDAAPVVITTATAHSLHTGDLVAIASSSEAGLNTTWLVTRISSTSFSLQGSTASTMSASTGASGTIRKLKIAAPMVSANFTISNDARDRTQAGVLGPISKGLGQLSAGGTVRFYYDSQRHLGRFIADEYTGFAFVFKDPNDRIYVFEFPKVKFTSAPTIVSGNDQDIVVEVGWAAVRDASDARTIRFCN